MLLKRKNAVIYGAGGAVGGAVARTFAREGANVFLAGRRLESIDMVAKEIAADGGVVEVAQVDALDENAVEQHIDAVAKKVDRIDVVFNAIGFDSRQGTPLLELALEDFSFPIATWNTGSLRLRDPRAADGNEAIRRDPNAFGFTRADGYPTHGRLWRRLRSDRRAVPHACWGA